jgi:hypothetical protein
MRYSLPDHDFAYRVSLRDSADPSREWPVGDLTYHDGDGWASGRLAGGVKGFDARTVDVLFRPSAAAAAETMRIYSVLPEVMEVDGVGVR